MDERSSGYVTDVGYTTRYHPELNPLRAGLAFLRAGLAPPSITTACELGFGQGVSLVVHAAAGTVRWWGNDLLPAHAGFAGDLNAAAGGPATLAEATFAEYARTPGLPAFDFIALHGVLSWVSAENRRVIAGFLRDRLAPGGVVYTGYNALPGWNDLVPLRQLLVAHAARAGSGPTTDRIEAALAFAGRALEAGSATRPEVADRFARLRREDRRYLAHEYFNRDWQPLAFTEVADLLAGAGLVPACSATLTDHLPELGLSAAQRQLLAGTADVPLRETLRDFLTGAPFRRDYWVREPRRLEGPARDATWRDQRVVLLTPVARLPDRVSGPAGALRLDTPGVRAVAAALAGKAPRTIAELAEDLPPATRDPGTITDAVFTLVALGHAAPAQSPEAIGQVSARVAALNAWLDARGAGDGGIEVRASAVTGGGT